MEQKFYICARCGQIVTKLKDTGVPVVCCGSPMNELVAGVTEASVEKHIPVVEVNGSNVHVVVGAVEHPMLQEHFIEWVLLETKNGSQLNHLTPGNAPETNFVLAEGDEVVSVYAYCNLHSLWKA